MTLRLAELRRLVEEAIVANQLDQLRSFAAGQSPEDVALLERCVDEITGRRSYRHDPARWMTECIAWKDGEGPAPYQLRAGDELEEHKRLAVKSLHGVGKSTLAAWTVLWFATTRDPDDWKIPTTASVWRQLSKYLWPEIHKWTPRLRWDRLGRSPFRLKRELLDLSLKLEGGEAFAVASDDPTSIEGVHADCVLYVYDESKAIDDAMFDAAEGAFAGTGEAYALAISTPGKPVGRFYEIHARRPGLENWHTMHVTLDDAIEAGRVSSEWAEQMAKLWGKDSAIYKNRVLGEFADVDEDSVIPLSWIEAANERWEAWHVDPLASGSVTAAGVDVARFGEDHTIIALRCGPVVAMLRDLGHVATTVTTGHCRAISSKWSNAIFVVDVIGIGAGVVDGLREWNTPTVPFVANGRTEQKDRTGSFGFDSQRSAAWWSLRELLDPQWDPQVALPPDPELTGDLTAPTWEVISGGKIKVESKDSFRKRLGRSPDKGDAVVMAFVADMAAASFADLGPPEHRSGEEPNVLSMDF